MSQWVAVLSMRRRAVRGSAWRQVGPAVPVQTRSPGLGAYSVGAGSRQAAGAPRAPGGSGGAGAGAVAGCGRIFVGGVQPEGCAAASLLAVVEGGEIAA